MLVRSLPDIVGLVAGEEQQLVASARDVSGEPQLTEAELSGVAAAAIGALANPGPAGISDLSHNREFRIVLLGQSISSLGDSVPP